MRSKILSILLSLLFLGLVAGCFGQSSSDSASNPTDASACHGVQGRGASCADGLGWAGVVRKIKYLALLSNPVTGNPEVASVVLTDGTFIDRFGKSPTVPPEELRRIGDVLEYIPSDGLPLHFVDPENYTGPNLVLTDGNSRPLDSLRLNPNAPVPILAYNPGSGPTNSGRVIWRKRKGGAAATYEFLVSKSENGNRTVVSLSHRIESGQKMVLTETSGPEAGASYSAPLSPDSDYAFQPGSNIPLDYMNSPNGTDVAPEVSSHSASCPVTFDFQE